MTPPEATVTFEGIGDVSYDSAVLWIMPLAGVVSYIREDVTVKKNDVPVNVGARVQPGDGLAIVYRSVS